VLDYDSNAGSHTISFRPTRRVRAKATSAVGAVFRASDANLTGTIILRGDSVAKRAFRF
jgi:hypothetical protein